MRLTSFDGLALSALYLPAQGESRGTVVAFHGYRSLATIDFALEAEDLERLRTMPQTGWSGLHPDK